MTGPAQVEDSSSMDHVVCGSCGENFGLANLPEFINHKQFICHGTGSKNLMCQSCLQKFSSPWGLLQHAQLSHSLKIFVEQGSYTPSIETSSLSAIRSATNDTSPQNDLAADSSRGVLVASSLPESTLTTQTSSIKQVTAATSVPIIIQDKTPTSSQSVTYGGKAAETIILSTKPGISAIANNGIARTTALEQQKVQVPLQSGPIKVLSVSDRSKPETNSVFTVLPHVKVLQPIKLPQGAMLGALTAGGALGPRIIAYNSLPRRPAVVTTSIMEKAPAPSVNSLTSAPGVTLEASPGKSNLQTLPLGTIPITLSPQTESTVQPTAMIPVSEPITISKAFDIVSATAKNINAAVPLNTKQSPPVPFNNANLSQPQTHLTSQELPQDPVKVQSVVPEPKLPQAIVLAQPRPVLDDQKNPVPVPKMPARKKRSCPCCKDEKSSSLECPCAPIIPSRKKSVPRTAPANKPLPTPSVITKNSAAISNQNTESASPPSSVSPVSNEKTSPSTEHIGEDGTEKEQPNGGEVDGAEGGDGTEEGIQCCNNQDCGVTIMPGTHESLKKCCNAVVPKKRKRHMETKHRIKKRATGATYAPEENTIYIDFQANSDSVSCVSSSNPGVTVSTDDTSGTITVNTSTALLEPQTIMGSQTPRSLTLSIPVSYTRKAQCPLLLSRQRPDKLTPDKAEDHMMGCRCECCPLAMQLINSVRRRSENEGKRDGANNLKNTDDELRKIIANVKTEGLNEEERGQKSEDSGGRSKSGMNRLKMLKKSSLMKSQGGMGKKRRYPTSKPFKCDQCDHAFNQRIHLKKHHQSKHDGVKPFKCEQCDYSTVERSHLKVHIRVHTGEKPFKCSHCEYATAQNSTLKIHLKRHHGQDSSREEGESSSTCFSCLRCQQSFEAEDTYYSHIETCDCPITSDVVADAEEETSINPGSSDGQSSSSDAGPAAVGVDTDASTSVISIPDAS